MSAGKAVSGGFFGCFGVLGAILFCLAALTFCASWSDAERDRRIETGQVTDGRDLLTHCVAAINSLAGESEVWRGSEPALTMPEATPGGAHCPVIMGDGRATVIEIQVLCSAGLESRCWRVADDTPR